MDIKAIRLKNFRGFRDATLDLKPLTVLLGPNSAGKSAFGHALAAMAHSHKFYESSPQASLTPSTTRDAENWPVDLGQTNNLRTDGATGSVTIGLQTSAGTIELGFGGLNDTQDLILSYVSHPSGEESGSKRAESSKLADKPFSSARSDVITLDKMIDEFDTSIKITRLNRGQWFEGKPEVSVVINGLLVRAIQHLGGTHRVLSGAARDALGNFLGTLTYLRATRKRPSRGYQPDLGQQQPIGYSGEWAPTILHTKGDEEVDYKLPPRIPGTDDVAIDSAWLAKHESLRDSVGTWLSLINLAKRVDTVKAYRRDADIEMRITLDNQSGRDITEIGFGVSQVIPVLVAGLLQPKDSLYIVDLPEAHLHPRPQGAIADFFCSLALSGRHALVETHSEMFFHRLRLRAAMNPDLMRNVAVYFIDPPRNGVCRNPRLVGLTAQDELQWPEEFLQEGYETEMQINRIRQISEKNA